MNFHRFVICLTYCAAFTVARVLKLDDNYSVNIGITGVGENATIKLEITANTQGYIGFGIGLHPNMSGADLFIGGVNNSMLYGKDYFGTGNTIPTEDTTSQDWEILSGNETNDGTTLVIQRLLNTQEALEDIEITDSNIYVLWSYGESDSLNHHIARGFRQLNLFDYDDEPSSTTTQPPSYPRYLYLDPKYTVLINIPTTGITCIIQLLLTVHTTGYIGFGLSHLPNMTGADLFIGGVDLVTNRTYGKDYHSTSNSMPIEDTHQNWWVSGGEEKNGTTTILVWRYLVSNDASEPAQDIDIENGDIYVLWSYGESDNLTYHGPAKGSRIVNLLVDDDSTSTTTISSSRVVKNPNPSVSPN